MAEAPSSAASLLRRRWRRLRRPRIDSVATAEGSSGDGRGRIRRIVMHIVVLLGHLFCDFVMIVVE
ncbi:hypothetical protein DAI22_06g195000 [Oryza sativa Japonica Group]|nr:hypothetical protein DAI22_06g195000 [Oryza sativa Japonica Group]